MRVINFINLERKPYIIVMNDDEQDVINNIAEVERNREDKA